MPRTLNRTKRARKNLALKLILESRFQPEVRTYFNSIVRQFRTFVAATGQTLPSRAFEDETISLLTKQYKRVSKAFSSEMRTSLAKRPKSADLNLEKRPSTDTFNLEKRPSVHTKQTQQEEDSINAILSIFVRDIASLRGGVIDQTTRSDMDVSLRQAVAQLTDEGEVITNVAVADRGARILKRKTMGREIAVVMTETQFSAESTKAVEAAVMTAEIEIPPTLPITSIISISTTGNKEWASVLDQSTRTSHVVADGQVRPTSDAFIVQGELLPYPGSSALGASSGNVINCRCSSLYGT